MFLPQPSYGDKQYIINVESICDISGKYEMAESAIRGVDASYETRAKRVSSSDADY